MDKQDKSHPLIMWVGLFNIETLLKAIINVTIIELNY